MIFALSVAASASLIGVPAGIGILPDQLFLGHFGPEVTALGPHVAVGELEPGPGEGVGELVGVLVEALGDLGVDRVVAQGHVGRGHRRGMLHPGRCASGIKCSGFTSLATHCLVPAGLVVSSHS
jgi:hypothetical protein